MSDMTPLAKMAELLYFKGNINNKNIDIKLADNKEITSDFIIVIPMTRGE